MEQVNGMQCFWCKSTHLDHVHDDKYKCKSCGNHNYRLTDEINTKFVIARNHLINYKFLDASHTYDELMLSENEKVKAQALFGKLLSEYNIIYIKSNYNPSGNNSIDNTMPSLATFLRYDEQVDSLKKTRYYKEIKKLSLDGKKELLEKIDKLDEEYSKIGNLLKSTPEYDLFICVKISLLDQKSNGKTDDYVSYAMPIFDELTGKKRNVLDPNKPKLKVFCSEITKPSSHYDSEIFAAMCKSKLMLVIAENNEHLESDWVKSEWRRWIHFMDLKNKEYKKEENSLITLFKEQVEVPQELKNVVLNVFTDTTDVYKKIYDLLNINNKSLATIDIPEDTPENSGIALISLSKGGEVSVSNEAIVKSGYNQLENEKYKNAYRYFSKDKSKNNLIIWSKYYCKVCQQNKKRIDLNYISYFNNAIARETNKEIRDLIFKCLYKETLKRINMNNYTLASDLYQLVIKGENKYKETLFNEIVKIIDSKIRQSDENIFILINTIKNVNIYNVVYEGISENEKLELLQKNTPFICDIIQKIGMDIKKHYNCENWNKLANENFDWVISKDRSRYDLYFQMISCNIGCRNDDELYNYLHLFSNNDFELLKNLSSSVNDNIRIKYIDILLNALVDLFKHNAFKKESKYFNLLDNIYVKLLSYIPKSEIRDSLCVKYLYNLGDACIELSYFNCAKKCFELIKDINKYDHIAYWKIILCKLKVKSDEKVKEKDKLIIELKEYENIIELLKNNGEESIYYQNIQVEQDEQYRIRIKKRIKKTIIIFSSIIIFIALYIFAYPYFAPSVKFIDSEGNVIYSETLWFDKETIEKPDAPTKDGYTFIEWEENSKNSYTAKYEPNEYEITFESNGGNYLSNIKVDFDSVLSNLPIPFKDGYEFDGWYYNDTLVNNEIYNYLENVTFEAKWNYVSYNLEYILNDGIADNPDSYNIDSEIIINNPVKKGHTFIGWKINNDLMVENYSISKGTIGNITLEAVYKPNEYVITLYSNNKLIENINVTYGKEFTLNDYKLNGYTFLGWYYNEESVTSGVYNFDGNINLNAKHEIINYSINYDLDGGIATNPSIYNVDSEFVINNPTKVGYDFIGWNYEDEMYETVVINKGTTGDKTFKAIFDPKTYKVTLDSNGGSISVNEVSVKYDEIYNYPRPKKSGYVFKGWYHNEVDYTQVAYKEVTDITLKAKWELVSYKIEYDLDGGTANNPESYNAESEFTLNNPTKKGYTFKGWKIENGSTLYQKITISKGSFGNKKYVAVYEINTYTINYNANGGTINNNSVNVKYDEYVTLQTPSKYGYDFDGWYYGSSKLSTFKYNYDKNITVEAKWKPTVYIISYGNGTTNVKHEYTIEDEFIIDNPTLKGHVFNYWINESNKKELTTIEIEKGTTGNMSFTPVFTPIRYSISYGNNSIDVIYGSSYNLTEIPTKDYHTFKSFSYNGKDFPLSGTFDYTEDIILTINWTPNKYNVTFNASGDVGTVTNSFEYGSRITFPSVKKENYILLNWESLTEGYNINDPMPGKNIVLKANWLKVKQNIDLSTASGDRDVVIDDGYESWPFIDRTGSHSETIYPSLDKQALKDAGYYNVWITITFDCYETKAGYQDVTVYSYADKVLYDNSFESGGDGSANKEWDRITFNFYTSIDNLYTDGSFWIKWSAHGEDSDEWKLGWTSITVEAVKDVIILL